MHSTPRSHQGGTAMFRTKHRSRPSEGSGVAAGGSQDYSHNIAARMGRWSAAPSEAATFGWLAFVVAGFGVGSMVGMKNTDRNTAGPGQSGRADRILDAGFKQPAG